MTDPAIRYRAFLSYSHRDTAWSKWLQRELERFRIDRDLVGRETPAGPVPKTLRPIFRDREESSGGSRLSDATAAALDASAALIVLCSMASARRPAVNEEVRLFRSRHPDVPLNLHFHNTRGTGLANVLAALELGVDDFDASVGGLGGCPYAPGASGNIATEELVYMVEDMGVATGVDLLAMIDAAAEAERIVGRQLPSQVLRAGPRTRTIPA